MKSEVNLENGFSVKTESDRLPLPGRSHNKRRSEALPKRPLYTVRFVFVIRRTGLIETTYR